MLLVGAFGVWSEVNAAKKNWRTVPGKITVSSCGEPRTHGRTLWAQIDVRSEYRVADHTYTLTKVSFRDTDQPIQEALDTVARYHGGDQVLIHYNPEDPQQAVIEIEGSDATEMFLGAGFIALLPLLVFARDVKQIVWAKKLG